jgi:phosphohistidine phosphatase
MILYILRHAEAVSPKDGIHDEWRYLTENGRAEAEKMASQVVKYGPKTRLTITSPLTRAVQTAEIVSRKACRKNTIIASELLLPGGDIAAVAEHLNSWRQAKRVMLVGHEPQLGQLIAKLLDLSSETVLLKPASCVALELAADKEEKKAQFLWYLLPGKKRIMTLKKAFSKPKA